MRSIDWLWANLAEGTIGYISSNFFRNIYSLHNAIYEQSIVKNFNLPRKFFFVGGFFSCSAGPEALDLDLTHHFFA